MLGLQEIILILAVFFLVFGPKELPKIARELGKAWQEFNKASSGLMKELSSPVVAKDEEKHALLTDVAKKLEVTAEGKTDHQLTDEILKKILNKETIPTKDKEAT
jgi:TatA/E family protein of Tat protein translocase